MVTRLACGKVEPQSTRGNFGQILQGLQIANHRMFDGKSFRLASGLSVASTEAGFSNHVVRSDRIGQEPVKLRS